MQARDLSTAELSLKAMGDVTTRVPFTTDNAGGYSIRIRNPEHRAKAEAFWSNLAAKRKQPGCCARCGRTHSGEFRQCDPCRVRVASLKARRAVKTMDMAQCVAMVKQCRREVTKLREIIKQMKRTKSNAYNRGHKAGKKHGLEVVKYHDTMPQMSAQELAQISHAYDSNG